ncbi:MAG TPA: 4Fe-4S binding protein [Symbiobacteriaceae bacterium]|nr:4Fe-4S binding protein [Symbiobacteriaceae bacterium]
MAHRITDSCIGCTACILACPVDCISGAWKEHHTIDRGRCIDCSACAAICPVDAITGWWVKEKVPKRPHWWEPVVDPDHCTGCDFCIEICPQGCLELLGAGPFFGTAQLVRPRDCIGCRQCEEVCAKGAITMQIPGAGLAPRVHVGAGQAAS